MFKMRTHIRPKGCSCSFDGSMKLMETVNFVLSTIANSCYEDKSLMPDIMRINGFFPWLNE